MKFRCHLLLWTFSVLVIESLMAAPLTFGLLDKYSRNQIKFTSDAPLEVVEGKAHKFTGIVTIDPDRKDLGLTAMVRVEAGSLGTGLKLRDTHMRGSDWLSTSQFPMIQFSLGPGKLVVKKKGKNKWFVKAKGRFSLKGRSKQVVVPLTLTRKQSKKGDTLSIKGRFDVNLSDFGINGPAGMKMIGARVADIVRISLKLKGIRAKRVNLNWADIED